MKLEYVAFVKLEYVAFMKQRYCALCIYIVYIYSIICVCIFSTITIIYNYKKWPLDLKKSLTFPIVEKGSNYLIKEFPNQENYNDAKEKVQEL